VLHNDTVILCTSSKANTALSESPSETAGNCAGSAERFSLILFSGLLIFSRVRVKQRSFHRLQSHEIRETRYLRRDAM